MIHQLNLSEMKWRKPTRFPVFQDKKSHSNSHVIICLQYFGRAQRKTLSRWENPPWWASEIAGGWVTSSCVSSCHVPKNRVDRRYFLTPCVAICYVANALLLCQRMGEQSELPGTHDAVAVLNYSAWLTVGNRQYEACLPLSCHSFIIDEREDLRHKRTNTQMDSMLFIFDNIIPDYRRLRIGNI